jgi:hypothetical protein
LVAMGDPMLPRPMNAMFMDLIDAGGEAGDTETCEAGILSRALRCPVTCLAWMQCRPTWLKLFVTRNFA